MIFIILDMHIHTSYSDGIHSPKEIVDLAIEKKLDGIAITDHDSIDGIQEAIDYSKGKNIKVISGIELSCKYNGEEVHVLGYFINHKDPGLIELTTKLKEDRHKRAKKILGKLNKLGLNINLSEVEAASTNGNIGRPIIARVLIEKGYVKDVAQAFNKYLSNNGPAYVEKYKLDLKKAVDFIHKLEGIAVIAHPGDLSRDTFLRAIDNDFDGIECIHPKHNEELTDYYISIAKERNLIITGGSDFHGENIYKRDGLGNFIIDIENWQYFKRG